MTAEFDNYRKRVDRERREATERAAECGAARRAADPGRPRARARRRAGQRGRGRVVPAGVELIHRQTLDLLTRRGVKPIETVGQDFDPHLHQAVASESVPGVRDGEIVEELRRGYMLGDRLLRPAMVKVAQA